MNEKYIIYTINKKTFEYFMKEIIKYLQKNYINKE